MTETNRHHLRSVPAPGAGSARSAGALASISAAGFGPFAGESSGPADLVWVSAQSSGVTALRLIEVLVAHGGTLSDEQLRFQTSGADLADIAEELGRMIEIGLVTLTADGRVDLDRDLLDGLELPPSMDDYQALSSDEVRMICVELGVKPPTRKGERIQAIVDRFADPDGRAAVMDGLSGPARTLLATIAERGRGRPIPAETAGLDGYVLHLISRYRRGSLNRRPVGESGFPGLAQLVERGIVGLSAWDTTVWIWREAIPLLDAPLITDWDVAPRPTTSRCRPVPHRPAPVVAVADRALALWAESPPKVLKNDETRLPKPAVRSTAKALKVDEATVELAASLLIDIGLILPNTTAVSGRGRRRTVERQWLPDPVLLAAWKALPTPLRWARLLGAWARPEPPHGQRQLLANRHLVLWELDELEPGDGYDDDDAFSRWIGDRHGTVGLAAAVNQVLGELRALGLIPAAGPIGLTDQARQVLADPERVGATVTATATSVIVQADLTVVIPPDLDHDVHLRLTELAERECGDAVEVLRLDEDRIVRAVQAGQSPGDIVAFLDRISSVPLADPVVRLVHDAAGRADRVRLVSAATVVIIDDPADLKLACSIRSAKLEAVAANVAVSPLPLDKVRQALDRKGLAPAVTAGPSERPAARSTLDQAADLRARAERARATAAQLGRAGENPVSARLERMADELSDPAKRLTTTGPLATSSRRLAEDPPGA
ncbi:MAG: helicase-associated domain-containing protein [Acidimicrobiales bacterium]